MNEPRIKPKRDRDYPWYLRWIYRRQKKKYGQKIVPTQIWGRSPWLFLGFSFFFRALDRKKSPIPSELRALVNILISKENECPFCVDLNAARLSKELGFSDKLAQLENYKTDALFSEKERVALRYAEAITRSDRQVDEGLFEELKRHFSDDEIVELTGLISFQNCSSKFNEALKIPSQGFCER